MDVEGVGKSGGGLTSSTTTKIFDDAANKEIRALAEEARKLEADDIDGAYSRYGEALAKLEEYTQPHVGRHGLLFASHKRTIEGILRSLSGKILNLDFKAAVLVTVCDYGAFGLKDEIMGQDVTPVYKRLGISDVEKQLILKRVERVESVIDEEARIRNRYMLEESDLVLLKALGLAEGGELYKYDGRTFAQWVREIKGIEVKPPRQDETPAVLPDPSAAVFHAKVVDDGSSEIAATVIEEQLPLPDESFPVTFGEIDETRVYTVVGGRNFDNDSVVSTTTYDRDIESVDLEQPRCGFFAPDLRVVSTLLPFSGVDLAETVSVTVQIPRVEPGEEPTITDEAPEKLIDAESLDVLINNLGLDENVTSFLTDLGSRSREISLPAEHTVNAVLEKMLEDNNSEEAGFIRQLVNDKVITTTCEVVAMALYSLIRMPDHESVPWATMQVAKLLEGFNIPKELAMGQVLDDGSVTRAACNNLTEYLRGSCRGNYFGWKSQVKRVEITGGRALSLQPDLAVVHNCFVKESREADLANDIDLVVALEQKQIIRLIEKAFADQVIITDEKDILDMLLNATSGQIQSYLRSIGKTGRKGYDLMLVEIADKLENKCADLTTRVQKHIAVGASNSDEKFFHGFNTGLFNIANNLGLESAYLARYVAQRNEAPVILQLA